MCSPLGGVRGPGRGRRRCCVCVRPSRLAAAGLSLEMASTRRETSSVAHAGSWDGFLISAAHHGDRHPTTGRPPVANAGCLDSSTHDPAAARPDRPNRTHRRRARRFPTRTTDSAKTVRQGATGTRASRHTVTSIVAESALQRILMPMSEHAPRPMSMHLCGSLCTITDVGPTGCVTCRRTLIRAAAPCRAFPRTAPNLSRQRRPGENIHRAGPVGHPDTRTRADLDRSRRRFLLR